MASVTRFAQPEQTTAVRLMPVAEGYRLWAETYDSAPNPLLALEERILEPLLPEVKGKNVLDVACGTGRWLGKLLTRGARSGVGIDFSTEMLEQAAAKPFLRRCLVRGDCLALPVRNGFTDAAICSFVVGYLADLAAFAAELARASRPNAEFFVTDFHPEAYRRGWKRTFRCGRGIVEVSSVHHSLEGIRSAFDEAGFKLLGCQEPSLGKAEQVIFAQSGKGHLFESACSGPAIFVCHFRRVERPSPPAFHSTSAAWSSNRVGGHTCAALLRLVGARVAVDGRRAHQAHVDIERGIIRRISLARSNRHHGSGSDALKVDLTGYLILPGLINAHDHLEFNLFPRLGHGPHANFEHWASEIYHPGCSPVREHREVPRAVRLWWGAIKNLLSGVTTVCHHNPFQPDVFRKGFPVRVVSRYGWAHSLALEKDVTSAFRSTPSEVPFIIHLGEGTDARSRDEIYELDRQGALDSRTIIVHGVALDEAGHTLLRDRRAALVWCPTSNVFTLGKTLSRAVVERSPRIVLGSDSALTAEGDLLDEARAAHRLTGVTANELYFMVTRRAAEVLRLSNGEGGIEVGAVADLIVIRDSGQSPAEALLSSSFREIEVVLLGGQPYLLSPAAAEWWPRESVPDLNWIRVEAVERLVRAPVPSLLHDATRRLGSNVRLAGKRISA
jgi:cytosine/adenosine deaminase-related metal-dependent hydrolase/ubiquinone/menaquinone biosynthesis C-methylase UbiE